MTESDNLPCPGCHTPLLPEATGCQVCMRPRTRQEVMRGYTKLRAAAARKKRRPFQIAAAVLMLGVGGKLIMVYGRELKTAAGSMSGAVGRWADDMRNPSNYASKAAPVAAPEPTPSAPAVPGSPVPPEGAMHSQLFAQEGLPAPALAPAPAAAPRAKPQPQAKDTWRVAGTVYDLSTLDPVPGAELTFLHDEKQPITALTNETGAYQIDLVKGSGWTVSLDAPTHRRGQLLDLDPAYRVRDDDERRAAFEQLSDGDLIAVHVAWNMSASKAKLDLVAVPHQWVRAPQR